MNIRNNLLSKIILSSGLAVVLASMSGCATNTNTTDSTRTIHGAERLMMRP